MYAYSQHNQSPSNLIGEINYQRTEQDYKTSTENYLNMIFNNKRKQTLRLIIIAGCIVALVLLIAAAVIFPPDSSEILNVILNLAIVVFILLFFIKFLPDINKKNISKRAENAAKTGEVNIPTKISFYYDRIEQMNSASHTVIPLEEIPKIFELADGMYIIHQNTKCTYIPARFFDKDSALKITEFLRQRFGANYVRTDYMNVPDAAEYAGEPSGPLVEESAPKYEFDFIMERRDVNELSRGMSLLRSVIITIIFSVLAIVCFLHYILVYNSSFLLYVLGMLSLIAAAFFALITFKSFSLNKFVSKNMHIRFFDDHVTMITEKSVSKKDYKNIKNVKRFKEFIRVMLNDNTFFYVPESAAQSAEQFAEFERFIGGFDQKNQNL